MTTIAEKESQADEATWYMNYDGAKVGFRIVGKLTPKVWKKIMEYMEVIKPIDEAKEESPSGNPPGLRAADAICGGEDHTP